MRARAVILSAVVLVSCSGGVARATAEPTRVITVTMGDFFFSPAVAEVHAGERITFVLKNLGLYEHEFMAGRDALGGKGYAKDWLAAAGADGSGAHDMEHIGAGVRVAPNGTATLTVVVPEDTGEFEFGCFIAGQLRKRDEGEAHRRLERRRSCTSHRARGRRPVEERRIHARRYAASDGIDGG